MATIAPLSINGLRELQAALKQMDGETQKQLRVVFNQAAQTVVGGAARRVPVKTGTARKSIRATSGQREAKVSGGSKKAAYYGWLDFGGAVGRKKNTRRRFLQEGRYIYPAYSANADSIQKALERSILQLAQQAGLEVEGG